MSNRMETKSGVTHVASRSGPNTGSRPWVMLIVATIGFAVNFWARALLSPLGAKFQTALHLSSCAQSLVVAVPLTRPLSTRCTRRLPG